MTFALMLIMSVWPGIAEPDTWNCRNTVEITCDGTGCESQNKGSFTPMSVSFDENGMLSVCAYTGCWEGSGKTFSDGSHLVVSGKDLKFSTAPAGEAGEDILIALDRSDNIAMLKAGSFSHPLVCKLK